MLSQTRSGYPATLIFYEGFECKQQCETVTLTCFLGNMPPERVKRIRMVIVPSLHYFILVANKKLKTW